MGDRRPKMGGMEVIRLLAKGNRDLLEVVAEGGSLPEAVAVQHPGATLELQTEPCARSDLIRQQTERVGIPAELAERGLDADPFLASQFRSRLFERPVEVVILSPQADLEHEAWRHQEGYLVVPPPGWEASWGQERADWFRSSFRPEGLLISDAFLHHALWVVGEIKRRLEAHVIFLNCSSVDPDDRVHAYAGRGETWSLRAHRFNLALMELSSLEGISIVDVDRLVAELGGADHVLGRLRYSGEARWAIAEELVYVLEDIGFFEPRPLVAQIGRAGR